MGKALRILLSVLILASCFVFQVSARQSITVTPQIHKIDLSRDPAEAIFLYKNATDATIELEFSVQDFKDFTEEGVPSFLEPEDSESYKYGLSSWVQLSSRSLVIPANSERSVKVYIDKTRLPIGGHYSSLLAEIKNSADENKNVKLRAILASLIFVRSGSEYNREEGKIVTFTPRSSLLEFPQYFDLRFQNTGNIDVIPHGLVEVFDTLGSKTARGIINENSLISLPETIRKYKIPVKSVALFQVPGLYRAKMELRFGQSERVIRKEISFFSFGSLGYAWPAGILAVLFSALFFFRKYKRRSK
jgi:hypothetical protein